MARCVTQRHATGEAKFWLDPSIELAHDYGLTRNRLATARRLMEEHEDEIAARGKRTSAVEITNVSMQGFELRVRDREHFVSFRDFPWFRDASIAQIPAVELPSLHHLYWPELDVDLAVDSLEHPKQCPPVSRRRLTSA